MSLRLRLLPAILALALAVPAFAHNGPHEQGQAHYQSIEQLGRLSFPTSTRNAEAQSAFVRGMLLLHLFEYPSAKEAFLEAQRLDPDFALAYWGEAMCATHPVWNQQDMDAGRAALAKLGATPEARAAKAPTAREKDWLATAEILYGEGSKRERDLRLAEAMGRLSQKYPQDDEAKLFHSLGLLGINQGDRDLPNFLEAARIAQSVFLVNPEHPGAAHYWIHGMDDPAHAEGALEAARALALIAPGAGHGQHMTAHIFMALGMWKDVVASNEAAQRVVNAELAKRDQPPFGCGHYAEWLEYGYFQQGREQDALKVLAGCEREGPAAVAWFAEHPGKRYGAAANAAALGGRVQGTLARMRGMAVVDSSVYAAEFASRPISSAASGEDRDLQVFAQGLAQAGSGNVAAARANLKLLQDSLALPAKADESPSMRKYAQVAALMLEGAIARAEGKTEAALALVARSAEIYDAIPFDFGPPVPLKPPHELAGEILLAAGRAKEAVGEFDIALEWAPLRAASLLGRARALKASRSPAAEAEMRLLDGLWSLADPDRRALLELPAR